MHPFRAQFLIIASLVGAPAFAAEPANQQDLFKQSYQQDSASSDESLRASAVCGMQALMDLASTKLAAAAKNGYCAYGKFRNSENLDRIKDETALRANLLSSVGSGPVLPTERTNTSFRRLDPSFLRQGEASTIAAEFERQTGMKREDFLTQMASVSERKIKRSDPAMFDKVASNFEGFLAKIPNAEFRKRAQKNIDLVPDSIRRGAIAKAVQKLAGFFADSGSGANAGSDLALADLSKEKLGALGIPGSNAGDSSTLAGAGVNGAGAAGDAANGAEAGRSPAGLTAVPATGGSAARAKKTGFEGAIAAALRESRDQGQNEANGVEPTIFQQVSQKYRVLTPLLSNPTN